MTYSEQRDLILKFFPYLLEEDAEELLAIALYKKVKNKEVILPFNKVKGIVFLSLSGFIRGYFINNKGEEKNIFLKKAGTFVGSPNALFSKEPSVYALESVSLSHILQFNIDNFESLASKNSKILKLLLFAYQENILTLTKRVRDLIDKTPEERYEDFIKTNPEMVEKIFNKHIANYIGITPVSLSRIIKRKAE